MKECCKQLTDEKDEQLRILQETVKGLKEVNAQMEARQKKQVEEVKAECERERAQEVKGLKEEVKRAETQADEKVATAKKKFADSMHKKLKETEQETVQKVKSLQDQLNEATATN